MSSEEVVTRLVQVGLFDKAVDTALRFNLPMDSIFEALASRYVNTFMCGTLHMHVVLCGHICTYEGIY